MNLDDLVAGLKDLSDEELREKMEQIRSNRRQRVEPAEKKTKVKVTATGVKNVKISDAMQGILDDMF